MPEGSLLDQVQQLALETNSMVLERENEAKELAELK